MWRILDFLLYTWEKNTVSHVTQLISNQGLCQTLHV